MITDTESVNLYVSRVMQMRAMCENLSEFLSTLPAPDDDASVNISYPELGSLGELHARLDLACEIATEMFG